MIGRALPYIIALVMVAACSEPAQMEYFCSSDDRDSLGRFCYSLDMSDSLSTYDIAFYTRIDCSPKVFDALDDIRVDVELVSPAGLSYVETVYLPVASFSSRKRCTYDSVVDYRKGLTPVGWGVWQMYLSLPEIQGLRGMGVINGKR